MGNTAQNNSFSGREAALARRRSLSASGKSALTGRAAASPAPATAAASTVTSAAPVATKASTGVTSRAASKARRQAMSTGGKAAVQATDRVREAAPKSAAARQASVEPAGNEKPGGCGCGCNGEKASCQSDTQATPAISNVQSSAIRKSAARTAARKASAGTSRSAALARRKAQSGRGKAATNTNGSQASNVRAKNPDMTGRELAQAVRDQRSRKGSTGQNKSAPTGRMRPSKSTEQGAAQDASWKVGVSETSHGQAVTGTMVGRSSEVTGDEASTCRSVTGTEYMGADIFRDLCTAEPSQSPMKIGLSQTMRGNQVTGNEVGRSKMVTGDEPGTCKNVTGSEYISANQSEAFCGNRPEAGPSKIAGSETRKGKSVTGNNVGRSDRVTGDEVGANRELTGSQYMRKGDGKAPAKVGQSETLRGGAVTGTMVGRSERVTGDEPGSCRAVTGDDYIGSEQYQGFCQSKPEPQDQKVGVSTTVQGKAVTGTMTGRAGKVTGDEPGTCKAVTGTPYAGAEQYKNYCASEQSAEADVRTRSSRSTTGASMTGLQPGIGGSMTGDAKGACEPVSGTPYVGADQFANACPSVPAEPGSPDFPQMVGEIPWGKFSVEATVHASSDTEKRSAVTGAGHSNGHITGPFGMATGKVTGTEEARFGKSSDLLPMLETSIPATAESLDGRVKSRVTGEGMDAAKKITGDDWDRGDRVTGTEGASAMGRNPTRRGGPVSAMPDAQEVAKRNEELPEPVSKVTGGSGNTEKGALVTYSGGARG